MKLNLWFAKQVNSPLIGGRESNLSDQNPAESASISLKLTFAMMGLVASTATATAALNWWWASGLPAQAADTSGQIFVQALFVALFFCGAAYVAARQLGGPVVRLKQSLESLVSGNAASADLPVQRGDEIGAISRGVLELQSAAAQNAESEHERTQILATLDAALENLKAGKLSHRIDDELPPAYQSLKSNFNETMDTLENVLGSVSSHAALIRTNARDVGQTADQLSQRTENQAATLEESSAAIEQMASSVASTADGAKQADDLVGSAKSSAEASGMVMDQAVEAMKQIETSSARISQVVSVIDDIAFQTNLLALNASVEAARAGDAGRGFAVVASEVRALAQRSSDAAKEIETLMTESEGHVSHGVQHVHKAVDTLRSIASSVTDISAAVSSIASTAQEQSLGVSEINSAISNLDQATQQTAVMVSGSATAGATLSKQAEELEQIVRNFGGPVSVDISPSPIIPAAPAAIVEPVSTSTPAPTPAANPVAEQQEKLARYVATEGSAALKADEPVDSDWVEF